MKPYILNMNSAKKIATIDIVGVIGWDTYPEKFIQDLANLGDVDNIKINLHSEGGYITDGLGIMGAIRQHKAHVHVHILGLAASMATVIASSADHVTMESTALYMIHNPWGGARGEAEDMRHQADVLDAMKASLMQAYIEKTGLDEKTISDLMDAETWMTAKQALELGFIDEISEANNEEHRAVACANRRQELFPQAKAFTPKPTEKPNAKTGDDKTQNQTQENDTMRPEDIEAVANAVANKTADSNKEVTDALNKTSEAFAKFETALADATATISKQGEIINQLQGDKADAENKASKAEAAKAKAETALEEEQTKVANLTGGAGHEEYTEEKSHLETYNSLSGKDRTAYFAKHQTEIIKEMEA